MIRINNGAATARYSSMPDAAEQVIDAIMPRHRVDPGAREDHTRQRALLCELKETTAAHFAHESAILREIAAATSSARRSQKFLAAMSQALIDEHLAEHDVALASLEFMIRRTLTENSRNGPALGDVLKHWFVNHAVKHDAHLKTLFQTIRTDCPELLARLD